MKGVRSYLGTTVSVTQMRSHDVQILQCHAFVRLELCLIGRVVGPDALLSRRAINVDLQVRPEQILLIQTSRNCEFYDTTTRLSVTVRKGWR